MIPAHPRELIRLLLLVALIASFASNALAQAPPDDIRKSLERAVKSGTIQKTVCPQAPYCNPSSVTRFYQMRKYEPAWTRDGYPLPAADTLARAIKAAGAEGLQPRDYHLERIETTLAEIRQILVRSEKPDPANIINLEFLLSDAYLVYAAHLLNGRVNPETLHPKSGRSIPRALTWRAISRRPWKRGISRAASIVSCRPSLATAGSRRRSS